MIFAALRANEAKPEGFLTPTSDPPEPQGRLEGESGHDRQRLASGAVSRDVEILSRALRGWGIPDFDGLVSCHVTTFLLQPNQLPPIR